MTVSKPMAEKAISACEVAILKNAEDFAHLMAKEGLPFAGLSVHSSGMDADWILFRDGSGFFADIDDNSGASCGASYRPWPLDEEDGDRRAAEYLPLLDDAPAALDFDALGGPFRDYDEVSNETLEAHLERCLSEHPDPPEAMRDLILDQRHEFEWEDRDHAREVQDMILLCAVILHPEAIELTIKSSTAGGRSKVQEKRDVSMLSNMLDMNVLSGERENMSANYHGLAHTEITESTADYGEMTRANQPLAWMSSRLLQKVGRPVGWEVDYNDGAYRRMSGYSAYSDNIVLEVNGALSNHRLVLKEKILAGYLADHGLLEGFQETLEAYGFRRLPEDADA